MSDEQYGKEEQAQDLRDVDQWVSELDDILLAKKRLKTDTDEAIKKIKEPAAEEMARLDDEESRLVRLVAAKYVRLRRAKVVKGKTLPVPSGTVSTRQSTSNDILQPVGLMAYLRQRRLLLKGTRRPPRELDKTRLSELMDARPDVREDFERRGLMVRTVSDRLTIKPRRSQLQASQELGPDDRAVLLNPDTASDAAS